jgi:diguanylate cyclase (GGDEF) domain
MSDTPELVPDFLARLPLFANMSELEINALGAFLEPRRFSEGEIVFLEGESGKELFIVRSGRIGSYVTQGDLTRRKVYEFGPGVLFGEMAIIEDEPRSATCYAKEASELLVLDGIDFYRLVWEHPAIGVKMLASMARVMTAWLDEASGFLGGLVRWGETARRRAIADELTGLFNRRFLEEAMATRLAAGSGSRRDSAMLMLDIDRFRDINARFGAASGDKAIAAVASAFAPLFREGEIAARLSGDEFAVFLPGEGIDRALELGEAMRASVEAMRLELPLAEGGARATVALTVSGGAAAIGDATDAPKPSACAGTGNDRTSWPEALTAAADSALYKAKQLGRNRVERA